MGGRWVGQKCLKNIWHLNSPLDPIDKRLLFVRIVERKFCSFFKELLTCTHAYNLRYRTLALGSWLFQWSFSSRIFFTAVDSFAHISWTDNNSSAQANIKDLSGIPITFFTCCLIKDQLVSKSSKNNNIIFKDFHPNLLKEVK